MPTAPSSVTYATVVGQFISFVADTTDAGKEPDVIAMQGTISFSPDSKTVKFPTATPNPVTATRDVITAQLDSEGYVINPADGTRGIVLVASDSPANPDEWFTYSVTITLGGYSQSFPAFFAGGTTTDLTNVIVVPSLSPSDLQTALASISALQNSMQTQLNQQNTQYAAMVTPGVDDGTKSGTVTYVFTDVLNAWRRMVLGGNVALANLPTPTGSWAGRAFSFTLEVKQGSTAAYTLALPTNVRWPSDVVPVMTTGLGRLMLFTFLWDPITASWRGRLSGEFSA